MKQLDPEEIPSSPNDVSTAEMLAWLHKEGIFYRSGRSAYNFPPMSERQKFLSVPSDLVKSTVVFEGKEEQVFLTPFFAYCRRKKIFEHYPAPFYKPFRTHTRLFDFLKVIRYLNPDLDKERMWIMIEMIVKSKDLCRICWGWNKERQEWEWDSDPYFEILVFVEKLFNDEIPFEKRYQKIVWNTTALRIFLINFFGRREKFSKKDRMQRLEVIRSFDPNTKLTLNDMPKSREPIYLTPLEIKNNLFFLRTKIFSSLLGNSIYDSIDWAFTELYDELFDYYEDLPLEGKPNTKAPKINEALLRKKLGMSWDSLDRRKKSDDKLDDYIFEGLHQLKDEAYEMNLNYLYNLELKNPTKKGRMRFFHSHSKPRKDYNQLKKEIEKRDKRWGR